MNVKLIQNEINCYELLLHTTLAKEETLEMIVPDACPDILEIVDTDATAQLRGKECAEGCVTLYGAALCSVLYQPENGGCLQKLRAEIPIQLTADLERLTSQSKCTVQPRITLAETRAVNPRKVLIRINLVFDLNAYQPTVLRYCTDMEERDTFGIEQRMERQKGTFVVHVSERPFTYADEVQISGSKAAIQDVLRVRSRAFCSETRLIGGKLVFKGGTAIQLLYLSREEQLCSAEFELPFSQILDVGNVSDTADFQLDIAVTGCQCSQTDPEGRGLSVELELLAQAVIRESRELTVITDAYSIRHPGAPEFSTYLLPQLLEHGTRRQMVREVIETVSMAQEVCEVRAFAGPVKVGAAELSAEVRLMVLYLTEEGSYASVTRQIAVKCPVEIGENTLCVASCDLPELDATATAGGIEVRVGADFQLLLLEQGRFYGLSNFELDAEQPLEQENQPSIVLRQITEGETLWEIAKAYLTTQTEIEQANGLSAESAAPGQMLLIPRKR